MSVAPEESAKEAPPAAPGTPRISVVLATYNRLDLLQRLLGCLVDQTLSPTQFEVIVVDDGSKDPVRERIRPEQYPFRLTLITQGNAGPSAARHRGVLAATGEILVLLDDDMALPPCFLQTHLAYHEQGPPTAVIGRYASDPDIRKKPIFERYMGAKWDQLSIGVSSGAVIVDGTLLATGNASMRRDDYLRAGGLDVTLPRAEDMALGLQLEALGVRLVFSDSAYSVHLSDHTHPQTFRRRAFLHGQLETRIARLHPDMAHADPWRYAFSLPLAGRALCASVLLSPDLGDALAAAALVAARRADALGFERTALRATGLAWGIDYFRGMRTEAGSIRTMIGSAVTFLSKAAESKRTMRGVPVWLARAAGALQRPNGS